MRKEHNHSGIRDLTHETRGLFWCIKRALLHSFESKLQLKHSKSTYTQTQNHKPATQPKWYSTAGIGAALADKLVQEGSKVIAVGRRQERLDAFVAKHGPERASAIKYDVTDRAGLDAFVNK
jgi:hypothetical protein